MRIVLAATLAMMAGPVFADQVADLLAGTIKECRGCDLQGANFKKSDLSGVNLTDANLTDANFHRATLRGTILTGVKATGANFNLADLTQAQMANGNFSRAMFYGAQISGARCWTEPSCGTLWPIIPISETRRLRKPISTGRIWDAVCLTAQPLPMLVSSRPRPARRVLLMR